MGKRLKDGTWQDSYLDKVKPEEPIFVLRAQDKLAPALIREWCRQARAHGLGYKKGQEALMCADEMEKWSNRKFPD